MHAWSIVKKQPRRGLRGRDGVRLRLAIAEDGHRAVNVMQHVVADAAENRPTNGSETPRPHHDHRHLFLDRQVDDRLARMMTVLHHHPTGHLFPKINRTQWRIQSSLASDEAPSLYKTALDLYIGWSDDAVVYGHDTFTILYGMMSYFAKLTGEHLSLYLNKTDSLGLTKA